MRYAFLPYSVASPSLGKRVGVRVSQAVGYECQRYLIYTGVVCYAHHIYDSGRSTLPNLNRI